ncbi:hypothetical protein CVU76_03455 [Candidatus Dojkabacteria bacterium HGW-Dojkabacteria-1]|uniref:Uncharacterized protein n=1 Tax=Candidatus Dojkabacteria bacterium HGW-Dojkabacteria-1 TaxID=2013761 RepID=A0A2N2F4C2_9BACT|nr:MAG: hypothetical protein CVU76_03455 [Candidatus Dojkabacteria bacterium HGW-Dojkabacteria-1]
MSDLEIKDTRDSTGINDLMAVLEEGYPNAHIKFLDYTQSYGPDSENHQFQQKGDGETFVNPFGDKGGHYRAELFVHGIRNSLVDPENEENKILIYPSFDKEGNVATIRLLKYPSTLLQKIKEDFLLRKDSLNIPNDTQRISKIPKIRNGEPIGKDGEITCFDPLLNSESTNRILYSPEKINKIKSNSKPIQWGKSKSIYPYENNSGQRIFLLV